MNMPSLSGNVLSRRSLVRALLGFGLFRFFPTALRGAPLPLPVERLISNYPAEPALLETRRYRAHAYIHVLAVPIFSRQDVGGGYAVLEQASVGMPGQSVVALQFAGGSIPNRTHGLNRVGLIQEAVVEQNDAPGEAAYFGFMVSSGEKDFREARKSLSTETTGSIPYSAAFGSGRSGRFECTVSHLPVPARFNWSSFEKLSDDMRARVGQPADSRHFDVALPAPSTNPNTFLYTVRRALLNPCRRTESPVVYNGKRYMLSTEKQPDRRMSGGTHDPGCIWRVNGTITEIDTRQASTFQIWFDKTDASGLPVRIEFYPKSFLRLVFEEDKTERGPKISTLFGRAA